MDLRLAFARRMTIDVKVEAPGASCHFWSRSRNLESRLLRPKETWLQACMGNTSQKSQHLLPEMQRAGSLFNGNKSYELEGRSWCGDQKYSLDSKYLILVLISTGLK